MDPDKEKSFEEKLDIIQQHFKKFKNWTAPPADNAKWLIKAVKPPFKRTKAELSLQLNKPDQAIASLAGIKNKGEKNKALELILAYLLKEQETQKAASLWSHLSQGRKHWGCQIAATMLQLGRQKEALNFSLMLEEGEREDLLRSIAIWYAEQHTLTQALEIAGRIQNPETLAYAKSNLVHVLSRQRQFPAAKEIALSIQDRGYREDAIVYIVKAYLQNRSVDEAIQFVDSFENCYEKNKPAKVIAGGLKALHLEEKVREVRTIFSLAPASLRRAA